MTKDVRGDAETSVARTGAPDRKAEAKRRLAAALRANLRRRKASPGTDDPDARGLSDADACAIDEDRAADADRGAGGDRG